MIDKIHRGCSTFVALIPIIIGIGLILDAIINKIPRGQTYTLGEIVGVTLITLVYPIYTIVATHFFSRKIIDGAGFFLYLLSYPFSLVGLGIMITPIAAIIAIVLLIMAKFPIVYVSVID